MEYRLTEEQQLVKNTLASFLDKKLPDNQIRIVLEKQEFPNKSWNKLATDGWIGMLSSEDDEFSLMDLLQVSELVGKKLYPAPVSLVASFIVPALDQLSNNLEKEKYLRPLIKGEALMTAILPVLSEKGDSEVEVKWTRLESVEHQSGDILLSGTIQQVLFAQDADQILVPIEISTGGISLAVVDRDAVGLSIQHRNPMDFSKKIATVSFDEVVIPKEHLITSYAGTSKNILEHQLASYIQCLNSEMIGGTEKVLNMAINFAKERKQFGQPIGAFQVIKHKLADMTTGIENAKALNNQTTWRLVNDPDFDLRDSLVSRVYTTKLYKEVCEDAIQLFGGMGFTWEQDIHFWYKSALYQQNHIAPTSLLKRYIFNSLKTRKLIRI